MLLSLVFSGTSLQPAQRRRRSFHLSSSPPDAATTFGGFSAKSDPAEVQAPPAAQLDAVANACFSRQSSNLVDESLAKRKVFSADVARGSTGIAPKAWDGLVGFRPRDPGHSVKRLRCWFPWNRHLDREQFRTLTVKLFAASIAHLLSELSLQLSEVGQPRCVPGVEVCPRSALHESLCHLIDGARGSP